MIPVVISTLTLIVLLAVPFGVLAPEGLDNAIVSYAEAKTFETTGLAELSMMLIGVIFAVVGATLVWFLSASNIKGSARTSFQAVSSGILVVGATIALLSSALWVGGGMATNYVPGEESASEPAPSGYYPGGLTAVIQGWTFDPQTSGDFWMISPVIVFLAAAYLLFLGLRGNTFRNTALLGTGVTVAAFLLPWSVQEFDVGGGDTDSIYYAAQAILYQSQFSAGTEAVWSTMTYVFNTFLISTAVFTAAAIAGNLSTRTEKWLTLPVAFFAAWNVAAFGASWIKGWEPINDVENFTPGYLQFLVLLPLVPLAFTAITRAMALLRESNSRSIEAHATE